MRALLLLSVLLFSHTSLCLDIISMKNGDVFRGEIQLQELNNFVQIKFKDGNEKRLIWKEIDNISKEQDQSVENSNEKLAVVGKSIFFASYGATIGYSLATGGNSSNLIPFIGPIIGINDRYTASQKSLATISTVAQGIGLIIWISALNPKKVAYIPELSPNHFSLNLSASF